MDFHYNVLSEVFKNANEYGYSELNSLLKKEWVSRDYKIGDNKLRDFVQYYLTNGLITKFGTPKHSKYVLGKI